MSGPQVAVVGSGYWGRNLVRNFAALGALGMVVDRDETTLRQVAEAYPGVRCATNLDEALADDSLRAVVLATPAALHFEGARAALEAGRDVFVEKPLALRAAEGRALVDLATRKGAVLMVGHILAYHPAVVALRALVRAGELGRVWYAYSNRLNLGKVRREENILWSFAPHDIAVLASLFDAEPVAASATGGTYLQPGVVDVTVTALEFAGGGRAHIFVSWLHPYKEQRLVVIGERKMAVFDDTVAEGKLKVYDQGIDWRAGEPVPRRAAATTVDVPDTEPLRLECEHFLECVRERRRPRTDGESGLRVLRVLEAGQRSLERGGAPVALAEIDGSPAPDDAAPPPGGPARQDVFVHPTAVVDEPAEIGPGTRIWHFSHVSAGARLGAGCNLGQNVYVAPGVALGANVKVQNNVSIYTGVVVEDDVFLGPSMVFTNVSTPRSHVSRRDAYETTRVGRGATVGANATIVCGTTLGRYAFVGAGAVVTRDVPDHGLVYGSPARLHGWVCRCGLRLAFGDGEPAVARCEACGARYEKRGDLVEPQDGPPGPEEAP